MVGIMLLADHHQTPGYDAQIHTTRYGATCPERVGVDGTQVYTYTYEVYIYIPRYGYQYIHARYHHRYTDVVSHGCYDIMVYMT